MEEELKEFARIVLQAVWDGGDVCGGEIQGVAERLGLVFEDVATERDVAAGMDCEVGDGIYRLVPALVKTDATA